MHEFDHMVFLCTRLAAGQKANKAQRSQSWQFGFGREFFGTFPGICLILLFLFCFV